MLSAPPRLCAGTSPTQSRSTLTPPHSTPRPGAVPWWRAEADAERDALIRGLGASLPGATHTRAGVLQQALRRYGGTSWPRHRMTGSPTTANHRGRIAVPGLRRRYERGSVLVTSNLPFDEWPSVFRSERLTGALLDRLTHHVHILEMNGESYRLKAIRRRLHQHAPTSHLPGSEPLRRRPRPAGTPHHLSKGPLLRPALQNCSAVDTYRRLARAREALRGRDRRCRPRAARICSVHRPARPARP